MKVSNPHAETDEPEQLGNAEQQASRCWTFRRRDSSALSSRKETGVGQDRCKEQSHRQKEAGKHLSLLGCTFLWTYSPALQELGFWKGCASGRRSSIRKKVELTRRLLGKDLEWLRELSKLMNGADCSSLAPFSVSEREGDHRRTKILIVRVFVALLAGITWVSLRGLQMGWQRGRRL